MNKTANEEAEAIGAIIGPEDEEEEKKEVKE